MWFGIHPKCIVTDSAPSSMYEQLRKVYKWVSKLPRFPIFNIINFLIKQKLHFELKETSVLNVIDNIKKPWLIIHGQDDGFVSCEMAKEIYSRANYPKELYLVKDADHTKAIDADSIQYWKTIDDFIEKYF